METPSQKHRRKATLKSLYAAQTGGNTAFKTDSPSLISEIGKATVQEGSNALIGIALYHQDIDPELVIANTMGVAVGTWGHDEIHGAYRSFKERKAYAKQTKHVSDFEDHWKNDPSYKELHKAFTDQTGDLDLDSPDTQSPADLDLDSPETKPSMFKSRERQHTLMRAAQHVRAKKQNEFVFWGKHKISSADLKKAAQMNQFMDDVYNDYAHSKLKAMRQSDQEIRTMGIDPAHFNVDKDGFHAALYKLKDGSYVTAFRGTKDLASLKQDRLLMRNKNVPAYADAARLAQLVAEKTHSHVVFAGHSLGGGDAAVAALTTGLKAYTINAAGVNQTMINQLGLHSSDAARLITTYHIEKEAITTYQHKLALPQALGRSVTLPATFEQHHIDGMVKISEFAWQDTHSPIAGAILAAERVLLHREAEIKDSLAYLQEHNP